jgi:hypothetical protein
MAEEHKHGDSNEGEEKLSFIMQGFKEVFCPFKNNDEVIQYIKDSFCQWLMGRRPTGFADAMWPTAVTKVED